MELIHYTSEDHLREEEDLNIDVVDPESKLLPHEDEEKPLARKAQRYMAGLTVMAIVLILAVVVTATAISVSTTNNDNNDNIAVDNVKEMDPDYWHQIASDELDKALHTAYQMGLAKNIILFIGDGMGATSVTAGRILAGQSKGLRGEEYKLSFDNFPHTGLSKTYNVDTQTTDSAASATAYVTGVKTRQGMLGLSAKAHRGDCASSKGAEVNSILKWFFNDGRSTGIVTTTSVTHATPASTYAHTPERTWESDRKIPEEQKDCEDIASQLVTKNSHINVVMGGGRVYFKPANYTDPRPRPGFPQENNTRLDGQDLTQEWVAEKTKRGVSHAYVTTKGDLESIDTANTQYLLGLFNQFHMQYEVDRDKDVEPSLAEMTTKAIEILRNNSKGYFLMVEGGRIDHGHHESKAVKALHEVVAFSDAVQAAVQMTNVSETLIVVTADHSHVMSVAGYSDRGSPILGKSIHDGKPVVMGVTDHMPYTTILYATGSGYSSPRQDITNVDTENKEYVSQSAVPMSETHGGEDVAIYARGPQSFLYGGVHEQNYIPMLMAYASCVGPYANGKKPCADKTIHSSLQNICNKIDKEIP